jgi:hypothetical protein
MIGNKLILALYRDSITTSYSIADRRLKVLDMSLDIWIFRVIGVIEYPLNDKKKYANFNI